MGKRVTVEICVGDPESAVQAAEGGADRIELCRNLGVGAPLRAPGPLPKPVAVWAFPSTC